MNLDADLIAARGEGAIWQGGKPPCGDAVRRAGFHVLVLCAEEHQPTSKEFEPGPLILIHCPLDDTESLLREHWIRAHRAAELVSHAVQRGKRVLVTCQAGLNRSGLVSALALRDLTGMAGERAAKMVQKARSRALRNQHFVSLLEKLPAREKHA